MHEIQQLILFDITIKLKLELVITNNPPHISAEVSPLPLNALCMNRISATLRQSNDNDNVDGNRAAGLRLRV